MHIFELVLNVSCRREAFFFCIVKSTHVRGKVKTTTKIATGNINALVFVLK